MHVHKIPFPTMNIKVLKYRNTKKGNKVMYEAKAQQSVVKNPLVLGQKTPSGISPD